MTERARRLLVAMVAAAGASVLPAGGPGGAAAQVMDRDLAACAKIADPDRRLACYDAVMRAKARLGELPAAPVPEAPAAGAPAGDAFGLPSAASRPEPAPAARGAPRAGDDFGLPPKREKRKTRREIELQVASVRRASADVWYIEMENGQLWQVLDAPYRPLKPGTAVVIRKGALGSYRLLVDGRFMKVRRLR